MRYAVYRSCLVCAGNTSVLPYYFTDSASRLIVNSSLIVTMAPVSSSVHLLTVAG